MKKIGVYIAILAIFTTLAAAIRLYQADKPEPQSLAVSFNQTTVLLRADELTPIRIQGEIVNAKGETKSIDGMGLPLSDLLKQAGVEAAASVTARARDEYSAQVPHEDFARASVVLQTDGGFQLVVFGDEDSRRNIKNLISLEAE